jgi:hypothetical protein
MMRSLGAALFLIFAALAPPAPPTGVAPDTAEPGSIEEIATATGDARFLSPWVAYLPASATVPSPRAFLGRIPGAPGELAGTEKAYGYCRALAAASPRVRVFTIGRSEEGREILMMAVADEAGIRDLDQLKAATAALADPRVTDPAAAERLIAEGRPIYYFNAVLHSDETGSTEAMLELAYRLAVSDQPMVKRIREQVLVLINPVSNPDGPRQDGRVVLPVPQGEDRPGGAAPPVAALLVEVRDGGHQPRRAPADPRGHEGRPPDVPRVAPHRGARPARGDPAHGDVERHRAPTTRTSTPSPTPSSWR